MGQVSEVYYLDSDKYINRSLTKNRVGRIV